MADWAGLQHDLVIEIAERVPSMESYNSLGAVCKSWRDAATKGHLNQKAFEGPWLMHAEKGEEKGSSPEQQQQEGMREFSSVSLGGKTRKIFLPEASKKRCLSCRDWLLVVAEDEIQACLLHPLSRVQINLPKLNNLPHYDSMISYNLHFVEKVVLSADPSSTSDFIVIVIWGRRNRLGLCKPGDTSWTAMDEWLDPFFDIVYCNNKLYALDWDSRVVTCDVDGQKFHQVFALPPQLIPKKYLVEFWEKFLIVYRHIDIQEDFYKTEGFTVFEVNIEDGTSVEVKDLGNKALFLGYNSSFSIECSDFNNCKPNCIYFTDDSMDIYLSFEEGGGKDMGIL
ncbi:uncharacterized protein LOC128071305 [Budorcas taxicolor]|uniref:uncharacterized protein LOC128071305 n=1 Tax=Budorcas taxicolor TaxID=37181 RepID=UPI0022838A9B|nr:uncharacterized protein LOC128071305 [Budorcas taxicolor]